MNIDDGHVVSNFIAQAIRNEPLTVQSPGTQTHSFCYVSDMVSGLMRLMEGSRPYIQGQSTLEIQVKVSMIELAEFSMIELAETVKELINPKVEIRPVDNTPDDPRQRKRVITKAKELLGWEPTITSREGLPLMELDFQQRLGITNKP